MKHQETIKKRLLSRRVEVEKELARFNQQDPFNNPDHAADNASKDTDAFEQSEHDRVEALEDSLKREHEQIEAALTRIEQGVYGICASCGTQIAEKRLEIAPTATLCIECKKNT